ncbi:RNA-directed DNA polymerase, eukaryota [Tanacetum coccineum]
MWLLKPSQENLTLVFFVVLPRSGVKQDQLTDFDELRWTVSEVSYSKLDGKSGANQETDKESTVASKLSLVSIDVSFRRSVRDGVERQQWTELTSILDSVILSPSMDRWFCDLNGEGVFYVKEVRYTLDDIFLPSAPEATRSNLLRRGVVLDSSLCPICGEVPEDIFHVLFRCDIAMLVFRKICRWIQAQCWKDVLCPRGGIFGL